MVTIADTSSPIFFSPFMIFVLNKQQSIQHAILVLMLRLKNFPHLLSK